MFCVSFEVFTVIELGMEMVCNEWLRGVGLLGVHDGIKPHKDLKEGGMCSARQPFLALRMI